MSSAFRTMTPGCEGDSSPGVMTKEADPPAGTSTTNQTFMLRIEPSPASRTTSLTWHGMAAPSALSTLAMAAPVTVPFAKANS